MTSSDRQYRLCREAGGICAPGYRKTHVRQDPACRLHGIKENMATSIRPRQKGWSGHSGGPPRVPFEHMTRLVTKGGIGLHFLPGPLDKWISREVRKQDGEWTDSKTGRQYRRQLARRTRVGRNADKPARIVDRDLPDLANETRCYMIRYPHEVKNLLKQPAASGGGSRPDGEGDGSRPREEASRDEARNTTAKGESRRQQDDATHSH